MGKVLQAYGKASRLINIATGVAGGITCGMITFEATLDAIDLGVAIYQTINPTPVLVKYRGRRILVSQNQLTGTNKVYVGKNAPMNTKPIKISRKEKIYGFNY